MELDFGLREMISSLRAAEPYMGLKKFTKLVNARLPPNIQIEKHIIRDLIKGLDEIKNKGTAANETTTTEQITTPNVALKPRDEAFDELTKQFFIAYRSLERKYLLNLDSEIEKQVRSGADGKLIYPDTYPAVSLRHHVEILLTLRGINPSTIMIKPHHDDSVSRVLTGVVLQCLVPLIESHELESYGFRLHYIVNCDLAGDGRIEGAWVFADAESLKWPLVRDLFFKWTPGRFVPARIAGAALGYPVQYPMGDTVIVKLLDDTEQRFIQKVLGKKVSYVQAFGFPVGDGNVSEWKAIMSYYIECRKALLDVGTDIVLDLDDHPFMSEWLKQPNNYNICDWSTWSAE